MGTEELEGIANRTDFDLGSHTKGQNDLDIKAKVTKNTQSNSKFCLLYTSPSPRDGLLSRMPSSA